MVFSALPLVVFFVLLWLPPAFAAEITDYDEQLTGQRREGAYYSTWGLLDQLINNAALVLLPLVEAHYGEYVEPVDFFIGFGPPTVFDMPLIATGNEDLYFSVSPSPYLDTPTLQAILYDLLYARRVDDTDYACLTPAERQAMADFCAPNRRPVLGLGQKHTSGYFWQPVPQGVLPP
jgi:hypothetical protein